MNNVILIGRLAKEPVFSNTSNGHGKTNITIAVQDTFKKDKAYFINCIAWGKTAEHIANYLNKGSQLCIKGELRTGSYDKDGSTVYYTYVHIDTVKFLDFKNKTNNEQPTVNAFETENFTQVYDDEGDIPF